MIQKSIAICSGLAIVLLMVAGIGYGAEVDKDKITVFQVPTSGKILDVTYHPEFDEWWVKTREGDSITVYSYDSTSKKWGKVRFVKGVPKPKAKQVKPSKSAPAKPPVTKKVGKKEQPKPKEEKAVPAVPEKTGKKPEPKPPEKKVKSPMKPEKAERKPEKKKRPWWDLRQYLPKHKMLLEPYDPKTEGH